MPCGYVDSTDRRRVSVRSWCITHILREASAVARLLQWAIPEPPFVERATSTALTLFIYYNANEESPEALSFLQ